MTDISTDVAESSIEALVERPIEVKIRLPAQELELALNSTESMKLTLLGNIR